MFRVILASMMCFGLACAVFAGEGPPPRENPPGDTNTAGGRNQWQGPQLNEEQRAALNEANLLTQSLVPLRQWMEQSQASELKTTRDALAAAQEALNKAREDHQKAVEAALRKDSIAKGIFERIDALKAKLPENMRGVIDNQLRGGGAFFAGQGQGGWSAQLGPGGGWSIQPGAGGGGMPPMPLLPPRSDGGGTGGRR